MSKEEILQQEINQLKEGYRKLESLYNKLETNYSKHQHDGIDGTNTLRKGIRLDNDQFLQVGLGGQATGAILNQGEANEQYQYSIGIGKDDGRNGFVNKADVLQMDFLHQPNNTSLQSFITARRTPLVTPLESTSISTTASGDTVTIDGYNFVTDELAGGLINIFNSSGSLVETQTIVSNTATEITIDGTWSATTSGGTFEIYSPVFQGSATYIWQRFYANEGTSGGIRFGVGPTAGGQNGLLYMDAAGDLYWRDKAGDSLKLNNPPPTP
jgi:hypothetical protein